MPRWTSDDLKAYQERVAKVPIAEPRMPVAATFALKPSTDEAKLNKTERAFLAYLRRSGDYQWIGVQAVTLKLGDDCRFTCDYMAITNDGAFYAMEVKGGFFRDDAKVKLKVAARMYPWAKFVLVRKGPKDGPAWVIEDVKP